MECWIHFWSNEPLMVQGGGYWWCKEKKTVNSWKTAIKLIWYQDWLPIFYPRITAEFHWYRMHGTEIVTKEFPRWQGGNGRSRIFFNSCRRSFRSIFVSGCWCYSCFCRRPPREDGKREVPWARGKMDRAGESGRTKAVRPIIRDLWLRVI